MLRLSRKTGEGIAINERIFVWVQKTSDGRCELAIEAPMSEKVRRCELPVLSFPLTAETLDETEMRPCTNQ